MNDLRGIGRGIAVIGGLNALCAIGFFMALSSHTKSIQQLQDHITILDLKLMRTEQDLYEHMSENIENRLLALDIDTTDYQDTLNSIYDALDDDGYDLTQY